MDLMTWLAQATPDDWHQVAWGWNWDSGHETLQWIIRQPTCDCGTALLVYWKGGPRYYAQYTTRAAVPEYERAGYDLVMDIERAYSLAPTRRRSPSILIMTKARTGPLNIPPRQIVARFPT